MSAESDARRANNRAAMPVVTAWIDDLRAAFGAAAINEALVRGSRGEPDWFHAREDGHELGTPFSHGHAVRILK